MIAYLKGRICDLTEENLVLEVHDIGYNVKISAATAHMLPGIGEQVCIYTYTYVREDAFCLYGFLRKDDLDIFKMLITVNGIGPKGGLAVLSVMSADELRFAVLSGDSKAISKAPGIGTKTAQRVILDLKDKISLPDSFGGADASVSGQELPLAAGAKQDAVEALSALGYSAAEALHAVGQVQGAEEMDSEEILKAALKHLF